MELQQLKYFQVVAIMENVTQAAEALRISQPALSKSLHKLDEDTGTSFLTAEAASDPELAGRQ
ncbi:MAG: LysR family transcriptional regulator [Lachnospiraceae bacterium]|nr:LysR family transcriptional regulator [Lachnospiraceae bacterium]